MERARVLSALIAVGALSLAAAGSQRPTAGAKVVEIQKLKDNLYVLTGGGGNSAALVTDLGVVLVDTKLAGWGQPMLDKIRTVTPKPVTTIINTHAHADNTGGNEFFPTSVEIIAQENTRMNMDKMEVFKGPKVNFLPKLMFKDKMTIGSGKERIDLYYFGAGHTGGDSWVVFPALRVMHAGDMIETRQPPIIDAPSGGSGLAYSTSLAKAATGIKNVDTIITGHGPVLGMKDLEEYAEFSKDFRNAVVSGYNHGLGLSEVAAAWKIPDRYRDYTAPPDRVTANVQAIFAELTR
jgi:glyoxylase-like metal-dependent hydrolase (beta-lactamase superfamily II)